MKNTGRLWRWLALVFVLSFGALGYLGWQIHLEAPPIPKAVATSDGDVLYTGEQIQRGQQVWLASGGQQHIEAELLLIAVAQGAAKDGLGAAATRRREVLDHPAGCPHRAYGLLFHAGAQLCRHEVPGEQGEAADRHHRGRDEGQEQLAVEARAHFAQQRPARGRSAGRQIEREHHQEDEQARGTGQHDDLGEVDEVTER